MNLVIKKILTLFIMCLCLFFLYGCWNYRDTNELSIVSGVAIDKNSETDEYELTSEIIKVSQGKDIKLESQLVEASGKTLFEAVRNMILLTGKKLYWSHAKVIIISEDVAKEGILPVMDFFMRDHELRITISVIISKEETAKKILQQEGVLYDILSFSIDSMLREDKNQLKVFKTPLYQFINDYLNEGVDGVLPTMKLVQNDGKETIKLSGLAAFKQDKLISFLDNEETIPYRFLTNDIKQGLYIVKIENGETIYYESLDIYKSNTKLKPIYQNNKIIIKINTTTNVSIAEYNANENFLTKEGREKLKSIAEKQLEKQLTDHIKSIQTNFGIDILGFGKLVKSESPDYWRKHGKEWNTIFKELEVEINSEIIISDSAMMKDKLESNK
ncbi:Ger(x)C family spore germination protein [Haloplasma contractile]|uniref:Ger(x)C family spore germination protein n=1 Tax=Haloplasma contractile TaxID=471825 RepID=UPI001267B379